MASSAAAPWMAPGVCPVATEPMTRLANPLSWPSVLLYREAPRPEVIPPPPEPLMEAAVSVSSLELTIPASPPENAEAVPAPAAALRLPAPGIWPERTALPACIPRSAMKASARMEPGARPTPRPIAWRMLSSLVLTFKKAMAQRNQTNRLPDTTSLPWLATAASTSASDTASAGKAQQTAIAAIPGSRMTSFRKLDLCIAPPYNASGLAETPPPCS